MSSSRKTNVWIIPGGGVEENEEFVDAAKREALEEAGVEGDVDRLLGVFEVGIIIILRLVLIKNSHFVFFFQ